MKLIKPSFKILEQGFSIDAIYKHIELCGRTCYKSTDKITETSATPFVMRMIDSKHFAILEHGTVYLEYHVKDPSEIGIDAYHKQQEFFNKLVNKYASNPYSIVKTNHYYDTCFITTNYRVLIENNWLDDLQYLCKPTTFHEKRISVRFISNIHFYKDLTRHRKMSYAIESTRYCNYTKDKFGNELTFIQPCWINEKYVPENYDGSDEFIMFTELLENIESTYNFLINSGWKTQQAATILPQATKAEIIVTGFAKDWKHIFDLRAIGATGKPHPQMKELMIPLMKEFINRNYISYDTECMV